MKHITLEKWKENDEARAQWASFIGSPAFADGFKVLESHAVPQLFVGESNEVIANRHAFHAGFHAALTLLSRLPDVHFRKVQREIPEWGNLNTEDDE